MIKLPEKKWEDPFAIPSYADLNEQDEADKLDWIIEALELIVEELNERAEVRDFG